METAKEGCWGWKEQVNQWSDKSRDSPPTQIYVFVGRQRQRLSVEFHLHRSEQHNYNPVAANVVFINLT